MKASSYWTDADSETHCRPLLDLETVTVSTTASTASSPDLQRQIRFGMKVCRPVARIVVVDDLEIFSSTLRNGVLPVTVKTTLTSFTVLNRSEGIRIVRQNPPRGEVEVGAEAVPAFGG